MRARAPGTLAASRRPASASTGSSCRFAPECRGTGGRRSAARYCGARCRRRTWGSLGACWTRGTAATLTKLLALIDPEGEYVNSPTALEPGTRHGSAELVTVFRKQWEIVLEGRIEIDRM